MTVDYVPGLAGVPAVRSKIGLIDGQSGRLCYRGYPIEELAEKSSFEETAYLLLEGQLPTEAELGRFDAELRGHRALAPEVLKVIRALPPGGHPMAALVSGLSATGMAAGGGDVTTSRERQREAAVALLAQVPTLVAAFHRVRSGAEPLAPRDDLSHAANLLYMLTGDEPGPLAARVMDACLVLHAEHGMNASTFAARVTGATLSQPHGVLSAAVATLAGSLHGGANERVLAMLRGIEVGASGVRSWAEAKLAAKEKIVGFGHRVYKVKDPRATVLQRLVGQVFDELGRTPVYELAVALESAMEELVGEKGIYPNVDFYSGILYEKLAIPSDLFTPLFAISRTAGWLAHWLEQLENNRLFRPSQIYEGDQGLSYTPRADRG